MDCGDIMAELNISISLEEQIGSIESIDEATDFLDEYHELHETGGEELKDLLFVFAKEGIENEYLRFVFEAHLLGCENCLYTLSRYQLIFKTVDEYGAEPIKAIWAGKLLEEAKAHKEKGNFEEAKKCLKKALELRPGDTEIRERVLLFTIVTLDDTPQKPELIGEKIVIPIMKPAGITVEYLGDAVWYHDAPNNEIFTSLTATSASQDKYEQPVPAIFETSSLIVEIHKGKAAGKLVIRLKE